MATNPNIKFRSFVCQGLNDLLLHEWIAILTRDEPTMAKFYETWAYVRASEVRARAPPSSRAVPCARGLREARRAHCLPVCADTLSHHRYVPRLQSALSQVMTTIAPLKSLPFRLSLDYEITRWDL